MSAGYHANMSRFSCKNWTSALSYLSVRLELVTPVLCLSENPRLILLVSSVGRIEVTVEALFEGIVRPSSTGLSLTCVGSATEGPAMRAVCMAPRKHSTTP
jgi:hypothetical protein